MESLIRPVRGPVKTQMRELFVRRVSSCAGSKVGAHRGRGSLESRSRARFSRLGDENVTARTSGDRSSRVSHHPWLKDSGAISHAKHGASRSFSRDRHLIVQLHAAVSLEPIRMRLAHRHRRRSRRLSRRVVVVVQSTRTDLHVPRSPPNFPSPRRRRSSRTGKTQVQSTPPQEGCPESRHNVHVSFL